MPKNNESETSASKNESDASVVHADGVSRKVLLDKAANFRGLGGFKMQGQGSDSETAKGVVFRSDQMSQLTENDIRIITEELGVRRVLDLRGGDEVEISGNGSLADITGIEYVNIPVRDKAFTKSDLPSDASVAERYFAQLTRRSERYVQILDFLSAERSPIVVHCVAGRDRTGLVSMLVLAAAGVSEADIADDYAATARVSEEEKASVRDEALMEAWKDYIASAYTTNLKTPEEMKAAMLELTQMLKDDYGSIQGYLGFLGGESLVKRLRKMLNPSG